MSAENVASPIVRTFLKEKEVAVVQCAALIQHALLNQAQDATQRDVNPVRTIVQFVGNLV